MSALSSPSRFEPVGDLDPISRSTRQAGLEHFLHPLGSVPFTRARGIVLTLGAPIAAPQHHAVVASAFLDAHPSAAFFYVTQQQLDTMALTRRTVMPVGTDLVIPLPLQQVPDTAAAALRKTTKQGVTLDEPADLSAHAEALREVQQSYLAAREVKAELRFLNRPCEFENERDARTFVIAQRGETLGFVVLDAYLTSNGARGYLLNMFRLKPTRLWNVYQAMVLQLAARLATEGTSELSLGFVPLTAPANALPWWLYAQHAALRWLATRSPYLQRLRVIKHGFEATQVPRFVSSPRRLVVRDFSAFLSAMGAP